MLLLLLLLLLSRILTSNPPDYTLRIRIRYDYEKASLA